MTEKQTKLVKNIITVSALVLAIGCSTWSVYQWRANDGVIQANEKKIADLKDRKEALERQSEKTVDVEEVKERLSSAAAAGQAVAAIQNDFKDIGVDDAQKRDENVAKMDQYLGQDSVSKRGTWYPATGDVDPVWEFMSTYGFTGTDLDVVWLCHDAAHDDALCAYATATYDMETNRFSGLKVVTTGIGQDAIVGTAEDAGMDIQEAIDAMDDVPFTEGMEKVPTDEEASARLDARQALKEKQEKEAGDQ